MSSRRFAFTLVGYRGDGVDSCRGCVMSRSSYEFFLECFSDAQKAGDLWAQKRFDEELFKSSKDYDRSVRAMEYTLLVNGLDEHTDPEDGDAAEWGPVSGDSYVNLERAKVEAMVAGRLSVLREDRAQALAHKAEAAAAAERNRQEAARRAHEASERANVFRLQAKFGDKPA